MPDKSSSLQHNRLTQLRYFDDRQINVSGYLFSVIYCILCRISLLLEMYLVFIYNREVTISIKRKQIN